MRRALALVGALLGLLAGAALAYAQACDAPGAPVSSGPPSVLIVMDASKSMGEPVGDGSGTRLDASKRALTELVRGLPADARVGLRLYGHRRSNTTRALGCRDTQLVSPVGPLDRSGLERQIRSYRAVGYTPIGRALRAGAADLPDDGPTQLVLVSDGGDNCAPPDPCRVAAQLAAGGRSIAVQAIGFQVTPRAREQLQCIAREGGGTYRDAGDAEELALALRALAARAVRDYVPSGRPVRGSADPARPAPVVAGTSLDSLDVDQDRWYAITLGAGQRLGASVAVRSPCSDVGIGGRVASGTLALDVRPPGQARAEYVPARDVKANLFVRQEAAETLAVVSPAVGDAADGFGRAGTYLVHLRLQDNANGDLRRIVGGRPLAAELRLDVAGTARLPRAAVVRGADTRRGGRTVVIVAAVGALVGALLGGALTRRRRAA